MSNEGKRYVFTWNRQRVSDPAAMCRTFKVRACRSAVWVPLIHPDAGCRHPPRCQHQACHAHFSPAF
jgi:hypothetical protein